MDRQYSYTISLKDKVSRAANRAKNKIGGLDTSFAKARNQTRKFSNGLERSQRELKDMPRSINNLEKELDDLRHAQKNAFSTKEVRQYQKQINKTEKQLNRANRSRHGGGLASAGAGMAQMAPGMAAMANPYTAVAAGAAAAGKVMYDASKMAMQFREGMARVNGTLQLTPQRLDEVSGKIKKMAIDSTTNIKKVPDAFYKIASATGGDLPASMGILKSSLKAAETGFGNLELAADATVNVMNAVGRSNTTAREVTDTLFATLNKGKVEFRELAQYMPELIPFSKNLGINFKETAGAFAFLTANGLKAEQTTTALKNSFNQLSKADIRENFKGIGVEIFNAQGKMRKFDKIARELNASMQGLTDEQRIAKFESLGLNQEAALGFSIMASKADELSESISYTSNSAGELQDTIKNTANPQRKLQKLGNQWRGVLLNIGEAVLPGINKTLSWALNAFKGVKKAISSAWENSELLRDVWSASKFIIKATLAPVYAIWKGLKLFWGPMKTFLGYLESAYSWIKDKILWVVEKALASFRAIGKVWDAITSGNWGDLKDINFNVRQDEPRQKAQGALYKTGMDASGLAKPGQQDKEAGTQPPPVKTNATVKQGLQEVTGGGKKQTNISVRLDKFMDELIIQTQTADQGIDEMEDRVKEILLRVLNSTNQMAGS